MAESMAMPALAALGFLLGFFYTRTMRLAEGLPEKYMAKDDCLRQRKECRHAHEVGREEVLQRLERMEIKVDRLLERLSAH